LFIRTLFPVRLTLGRWVLAKVLGLVTAEEPSGLNLRGGPPGQLLVEVDNALHGDGVRVGSDRLRGYS